MNKEDGSLEDKEIGIKVNGVCVNICYADVAVLTDQVSGTTQ